MHRLALRTHTGVRFWRPIVKRAEPVIERKIIFSVIALKIAVMQLVKERRRGHSITPSHLDLIKPHMPLRRCKRCMLCIHQHVNRMGRHHPVNQNTAKIQQMLNRVHSQPGPRPNIDILVMQIVRGLVQRFPMGQAVNPIKMEKPPELNTAQQRNKINRFCAPIDIYGIISFANAHIETTS